MGLPRIPVDTPDPAAPGAPVSLADPGQTGDERAGPAVLRSGPAAPVVAVAAVLEVGMTDDHVTGPPSTPDPDGSTALAAGTVPTIDRNRSPHRWDVNGHTLRGTTLDVWQYLDRCLASQGYAPSYREVRDYCGVSSPSTVWHHMELLTAAGVVERRSHTSRALRLLIPFPYQARST